MVFRSSCRGAEADPHGPCDRGESTVAVRLGFFVPVVLVE